MIVRARTIACAAALIGLGTSFGTLADPSASAGKARTSAVQASGAEYRISLSRSQVKPSKLRLEFVNYGEDDHDLAIRKVGSSSVRNLGLTHPGQRNVGRFTVHKGTYMLWCTIADHRARGMRATLKVRSG